MMDQVARAKANDDAVMREVRRYHAEGQIHAIDQIIQANPDLHDRIWDLIAELNEVSLNYFVAPELGRFAS